MSATKVALKRLAAVLPRPVRARLAAWARSGRDRLTVPAAIQAHLARPGRSLELVDGRPVVVHDVGGVEPWRASSLLAARVQRVLHGLGVEHWSVQPRTARITKWAVREVDLDSVIEALGAELAAESCYLRVNADGALPRLVEEGLGDAADARAIELFQYQREPNGRIHHDYSICQLYSWRPGDRDTLCAPGRAGIIHEVEDSRPVATTLVPTWDGAQQPRPTVLATPDATEIDFGVDAVYMWVDDSDPAWRARRDSRYRAEVAAAEVIADDSLADFRFRDRGELRASLRSLEAHAPWIRRIFLVTDQQRPQWLDPASTRVVVVDHRDFVDPVALPTFSSHVIGSQLHRIPGLAARYLVVNDDILFNRPVTPIDFFTPQGSLKVVLSRSRRPLISPDRLTPLEQARANSAGLIERDHGRRVTSLFAHVPIPQSIEVAKEVDQIYAAEVAETLRHPFRSPLDYEVNSWLHLNRALFTGRAVTTTLPFVYFDVGSASARAEMADPRSFARAMFLCVNDSSPLGGEEAAAEWFSDWLERLFPTPAAHERALPGATQA